MSLGRSPCVLNRNKEGVLNAPVISPKHTRTHLRYPCKHCVFRGGKRGYPKQWAYFGEGGFKLRQCREPRFTLRMEKGDDFTDVLGGETWLPDENYARVLFPAAYVDGPYLPDAEAWNCPHFAPRNETLRRLGWLLFGAFLVAIVRTVARLFTA